MENRPFWMENRPGKMVNNPWLCYSTESCCYSCHVSHEENPLTFHYSGCLIGILIMVYYNPYITGWVFIPYITKPTRGPFFVAHVSLLTYRKVDWFLVPTGHHPTMTFSPKKRLAIKEFHTAVPTSFFTRARIQGEHMVGSSKQQNVLKQKIGAHIFLHRKQTISYTTEI